MTPPRNLLPPRFHLIRQLSRPLIERETWQAETVDHTEVAVKFVNNPFHAARLPWLVTTLDRLHSRGYPVPRVIWHGLLDESWFVIVQEWVPGVSPMQLHSALLQQLEDLIDVHAMFDVGSGGWDTSEWIANVVFDEWEGWWQTAETGAAELAHRLRTFAEPARGSRLPSNDLVHHDFSLSNILMDGSVVTGVLDWEAAGRGSRALDLTTLLFEWHRLFQDGMEVAPDGNTRLARHILDLTGESGVRSLVTYGALARLALTRRRGELSEFAGWQRSITDLLDALE
jgi:aminoglycoside phosphotransferase (APT) family kinase protein